MSDAVKARQQHPTANRKGAAGMAQGNIETLRGLIEDTKHSVEALGDNFDAFRNALPDAYVPRREVEGNFREFRERSAGHETRLTAMEEWRLAETQRAAQAQIALQTQIQAEAVNAVRAIADAREKGNAVVNEHRAVLDARTMQWLQSALLMVGGAVLYYVFAHLIH